MHTLSDVSAIITDSCLEHGRQLLKWDGFPVPDVTRGGEIITALIPRAGKPPFRVYVRIKKKRNRLAIHGECSCPRRVNCEHVAAVLLRTLDNDTAGDPTQGASKRKPSSPRTPTRQDQNRTLLYILQPDDGELLVESMAARRLKQGGYSQIRPYAPARAMHHTPASFLSATDLSLLKALDRLPRQPLTRLPKLSGTASGTLLESLIDSGRCFLGLVDGNQPLRIGAERELALSWSIDAYARPQPEWQITPGSGILLRLSPLHYLDADSGECGRLRSPLPTALVNELAAQGAIPAETATTRLQQLAKAHPALPLPPRLDIDQVNPTGAAPMACLCLTTRISEWGDEVDLARLDFDYQGVILDRHSPASRLHDGRAVSIKRHPEAEQAAVQRLRQLGLREEHDWNKEAGDDCFTHALDTGHDDPEPWLDFQADAIPALRAEGWRIHYHNFRYRLADADNWICDVTQLERQEWFDITLGVEVEGEQVDLLPALLDLIRKLPHGIPDRKQVSTEHLVMPVGNPELGERLLRLPVERVWPILELLYEFLGNATSASALASASASELRLSRIQLSWLSALSDDPHWLADQEMVQISRRLRELEGIPRVNPPQGLRATLRPYQQQGLAWLQFLREYRLAGILADDMGLGKTLQALAHLLLEQESGRADRPSLVVAPTSLLFNWRCEAERFAPGLKVLVLHGPQRRQQFKKIKQHDLVITSYPLLARDQATLRQQPFHLLILDEAQVIKNPASQAGRVLRELDTRHRLCLTGTPMENHLGELWSLFDFLLPGLLGNEKQFRRLFRQPIEKHGDSATAQRLGDRVRPFLLRRTKQQVASELPEKSEIIHRVVLEGKQRDLYESVRLTMHRRVREEIARQGVAHSRILVLDALLKLRQVCCDPRLVDNDKARAIHHSAKLEALMALLSEMLEEGRRILIFSQFTGMLGLIEQALQAVGHDYAKLTGRTRNREQQVRRFQESQVPLFLISLKAGGVGLNLTAADTVIHYDPWWNPAVERQATDRAHRIGQQRAVFVYKLICAGTLEERILTMQQRKQALADNLYQKGGNQEPTWSEADLESLFTPLDEF